MLSIDFVAIILIGGLGRVLYFGTFIIVSMPEIISVWVLPALQEINPAYAGMLPPLRENNLWRTCCFIPTLRI